MLNELVRAKGAEVLDHLVGLPPPAPVVTYIQYVVKNLNSPTTQTEPSMFIKKSFLFYTIKYIILHNKEIISILYYKIYYIT